MLTITITIGRNIKNVPMSDLVWIDFQTKIKNLFQDVYVDAEHTGVWQGVTEQSKVYVGTSNLGVERLERTLATFALAFGQDAIGLLVNLRQDSVVYAEQEKIA